MSLRDRAGVKPKSVGCPDYEAVEGGRRCVSFREGGCELRSHPACEPWVKANPSKEPADAQAAAVLKAHPDYREAIVTGQCFLGNWRERMLTITRSGIPSSPRPPTAPQSPADAEAPDAGGQPIQWPTEADVASFGLLGMSVRVGSESLSEDLWLVPVYTGEDRLEMTAADAMAVCRILRAFPGAKVADVIRDRQTQTKEPAC